LKGKAAKKRKQKKTRKSQRPAGRISVGSLGGRGNSTRNQGGAKVSEYKSMVDRQADKKCQLSAREARRSNRSNLVLNYSETSLQRASIQRYPLDNVGSSLVPADPFCYN
jgi:hypothetical protein